MWLFVFLASFLFSTHSLAGPELAFVYPMNPFDLRYDKPNPAYTNLQLDVGYYRNYNEELARLYRTLESDSPFSFCATDGFGCNIMSQNGLARMRQQQAETLKRTIQENELDFARATQRIKEDIERLKAGKEPEVSRVKDRLKDLRDKASLAAAAEAANSRLSPAERKLKFQVDDARSLLRDLQNRAAPEPADAYMNRLPRPAGLNDSSIPQISMGYSGNPASTHDEMMQKALGYARLGAVDAAQDLAAMAGRWQTFQTVGRMPNLPISPAAEARFPMTKDLNTERFQGYEAALIANRFADLQYPLAALYGDALVPELVALQGAQGPQGPEGMKAFLSAAEFSWNVLRQLATNPEFQGVIWNSTVDAVKDNVTGVWHLVRHPIDSAESMTRALWHYRETWELVKNAVSNSVDALATCDQGTAACGEVLGQMTGDISFGLAAGGVVSGLRAAGKVEVVASRLAKMSAYAAEKAAALEIPGAGMRRILGKVEAETVCVSSLTCGPEKLALTDALMDYAKQEGVKGEKVIEFVEESIDSAKNIGMSRIDDVRAWAGAVSELSESRLAKVISESKRIVPGISVQNISPDVIKFSQSSVNDAAEITASMRANGWIGEPIDVVKISDGTLITVDNTRVLAAARSGIDVKAVVRSGSETLSAEMVERFSTPSVVPRTWEEAVKLRIRNQNRTWSKLYPNGSYITRSIE